MVFNDAPWNRAIAPVYPPFGAVKRALRADVVLGVTSKRCAGNGICSMYTRGRIGRERAFIDFAPATLRVDERENLLLELELDGMRTATRQKHFAGPYFEMEEDFQLPDFVREALALNRMYIAGGLYTSFSFGRCQYVLFPAP